MNGLEQDTALLKALAEFTGLPPSVIAAEAGLADTTISRPYKGAATTRLSAPTLDKLRKRFPEFPGWTSNLLSERQLGFRHKEPARDPDLVEIAQVDIRYGLGGSFLDLTENAAPRTFSRAWLREFTKASPENLFWAIGDGDSMEPTIRSGEIILIDRSQQTPRMAEGIWAVAIGEIGMVKRLHFPGQGRIELLSDNGLVPPVVPGEDELQIIGRVVAVVRKL